MNRSPLHSGPVRLLRRAAMGVCAAALLAVAAPMVAGASTISSDEPPTIVSVAATGGDITVTWTNDAPDASSIDVILYDRNGNVIEDDHVGPAVTSDTMDGIADGGGYAFDVIANTPEGPLDPGASSAFDVYQGAYIVDQAPTIVSVTASGGDITVSWTNDALDASSIDVILYDLNGNVIEDDHVDPTATTDTMDNIADGGGYTVDVIANTPGGPLDPGTSSAFDIFQGAYIVDQAPTIGTVSAMDSDVTVTWTNAADDATSIDVILYDQNGNVIEDDNVGPSATTDTMDNIADGGGYTFDIVANTPGGALDSGASSAFDIYQGSYIVDQAPTIGTIVASNGDVTVTWTNDAADATSIDVILYDLNDNVIEDDNVGPAVTTDTFGSVPDGQGYTIDVIANTPGGALDPGGSVPFDVTGGSISFDAAPTIGSITADGGVVTVVWTSNASDVTGYDAILYNSDGSVITDDSLGATALSDTFGAVADGSGYTVGIVAHTPAGDFTATSATFSLVDGSVVTTFPTPVVTTVPAPIVVPSAEVTVTPIDGGVGGWTVSWPELTAAPTDGTYVVTDDQGDTCSAAPTGVAGTPLSCTLPGRSDGTTNISGVTVTFEYQMLFFSATSTATDPRATATDSSTTTRHSGTPTHTTPSHVDPPTGTKVLASGALHSGSDPLPVELMGAGAVALIAAALVVRRRRRAAV